MVARADRSGGTLLTLEEFERLPEEDAFRLELSRGQLVREPRPGAEHGWLATRLFRAIDGHVRKRELGAAVIETGFLLPLRPATVRGPDVAFISKERLPPGDVPTGFWPLAPDLAVEVLSPSNTAAEMQQKVLEYLEAGSRLVWVVDPRSRTVTVWRPPSRGSVLREEEVLDGGDVLPGFRVEVAEIFGR